MSEEGGARGGQQAEGTVPVEGPGAPGGVPLSPAPLLPPPQEYRKFWAGLLGCDIFFYPSNRDFQVRTGTGRGGGPAQTLHREPAAHGGDPFPGL